MRVSGRKGTELIVSGENLAMANRIYRGLALAFPWRELRRTTNLSETTTAGTAAYNWPTTIKYVDMRAFEIQDQTDRDLFKPIPEPPDEQAWTRAAYKSAQSVPDHHQKYHDGTRLMVELRPAPKYGGRTLRVVGTIEPAALINGNSVTFFETSTGDDAFEMVLAAEFLALDGVREFAQFRLSQAGTILETLFGNDIAVAERLARVVTPIAA